MIFFCAACFNRAFSQGNTNDSSNYRWCETYALHSYWLPDEYMANALCACGYLPLDSAAKVVRRFLIQALDTAADTLKILGKDMKTALVSGSISKKEYTRFVKKYIVPKIYADHVAAYRAAGCTSGPAPYWEWRVACTHRFKDCEKMVKRNLQFGGACNKKSGQW